MNLETEALIEFALEEVRTELIAAYENFPDMRSAHEGIAIIEEEFIELRDAGYWPHKQDDPNAEEKEAEHLAAMCVRYLVDIVYKGGPR
jgi:hypothetical protein